MDREKILTTIHNEKLSTEELSEIMWMLNKQFYKERPVTIDEFCNNDDFVHKKWPNIFPLWRKTLNELFPTPFNAPYNEVLISAAAGSGKCHIKDTPILMYDQTVKMVQDIISGDLLMGDDGTPRNVLTTNTGNELCYKVTLEDGSWFGCNKSHILSIRNGFTGNILNMNIEDYLNNKEYLPEYFAYKYNDNKLYNFKIEEIGKENYYGFTIDGNHLYTLADGTITHNTVTATISVLYDLYKLGCLINPCQYYGLSPDTMIIMAIFSATGATAAVNWNDITTGIEACPWMMDKLIDKRGLEKKHGSIVPVEILKGLYIQTGSKFQHSMGKAIFDGLMDEAAFGGNNLKEAQKTYNELSSRMKTRFSTYSETGNLPGHLFLISSPKEAGDVMQYRIEESKKAESKMTKIMMNISSWDSNPNNDSDDKFTVFIGNENKEPCIYDPGEDVPIEEMDYLIYPPMRYYEEFKKDLLISIMNYGGITTTSDMALFKSPLTLKEMFVLNNPFQSDVIELPFGRNEKTLMDFCNLRYFKDIRHPDQNRFIHIDAAYSSNTLDVYGLAAGYCIQNDTPLLGNTQQRTETTEDVFIRKDRSYFIDFAIGITAPHGQEVNLTKVQDFVEYLIKNMNYPVECISADQFQSKQTLQNFELKGYNTEYISVDRSRDPYLFLRHIVHNRQLLLPKSEELFDEMKKLRDDGKKVDHPVSCARGDMVVKLLDGQDKTIKELADMGPQHRFWVYSCTPDGTIVPALAYNAHKTKIATDLIEITLEMKKK